VTRPTSDLGGSYPGPEDETLPDSTRLQHPIQAFHLLHAMSVIEFAQKCEFSMELDRIELALVRRMAVNPSCGYEYLFLAAALGNHHLRGMCIASVHAEPPSDNLDAVQSHIVMSRILDVKTQDLTGFMDIYRFGPEFTMSVINAGGQARKGPLIDYQIMGKLFTQMMIPNGKSLSITRGKLTSSK